MKNLPITHYEKALSFFNNYEISFKEIFKSINEKFGRTPKYDDFYFFVKPSSFSSKQKEAEFANQVNILYHFYYMYYNGEKIYYVTPELTLKLAQTSLNIDTYFLKSPFSEIFIVIDKNMFFIDDIDGTVHPIQGFYVNFREEHGVKYFRIMAVALLESTKEIPFNDSTFYFRFELNEGKTKEAIKTYLDNLLKTQMTSIIATKGIRNFQHIEEFSNFVFNALLYITSRDADLKVEQPEDIESKLKNLKSKSKINKLLKRSQKVSAKTIIVAGSSIKNSSDFENFKKTGSINQWKLNYKIKVSGHWRKQWYGSEKDNSKRQEIIWVSDYEKGPDFANEIKKPYIVK